MPNPLSPPWEHIDSALTPDRLAAIATIIVQKTNAKIATRDERDCSWNLSCDCYAWVAGGIHDAAVDEHADWLYPVSQRYDLNLTFRIGGRDGVTAKIYRPDSPGQPTRTLKQANDQFRAIQESLGPVLAPTPEPEVRFAIDKGDDGRVTLVRLVQLSLEGEPLYSWTVWNADAAVTSIDDAPRAEAVELEGPVVQLQEDVDREAAKEDQNDRQQGA